MTSHMNVWCPCYSTACFHALCFPRVTTFSHGKRSCLSVIFLHNLHLREAGKYTCVFAKSLQLCPALRDLMDCSPPASSAHGILQARILGWVAMPSSRGSSQPWDGTCLLCFLHWQADSLPLNNQGKMLDHTYWRTFFPINNTIKTNNISI